MATKAKGKTKGSGAKGKTKASVLILYHASSEPATSLKEILSSLATDPRKLGEFLHQPDAAMAAAKLSETDTRALRSGVAGIIAARLAGMPLDQAFDLKTWYNKAPPPQQVIYPPQFVVQPPQYVVYPQFVVHPPPQHVVYPPQFVVHPPPQYVVYPPQFVVQPPPYYPQ